MLYIELTLGSLNKDLTVNQLLFVVTLFLLSTTGKLVHGDLLSWLSNGNKYLWRQHTCKHCEQKLVYGTCVTPKKYT